jgi:hypothetical protein
MLIQKLSVLLRRLMKSHEHFVSLRGRSRVDRRETSTSKWCGSGRRCGCVRTSAPIRSTSWCRA